MSAGTPRPGVLETRSKTVLINMYVLGGQVQAAVLVCTLCGDHMMSAGTLRPVVLGYKE